MMKNLKYRLLLFCSIVSLCAFSQEAVPDVGNGRNAVTSINYNFAGSTVSKGAGFYNALGKFEQSQTYDILKNRIWVSETKYDYFGRPVFSTLSAPKSGISFGYYDNFVRFSGGEVNTGNFDGSSTLMSPPALTTEQGTLGWYYSTSNTYDLYQDVTSYPYSRVVLSNLNPGMARAVLGGKKVGSEWLQTYSFTMPAEKFYGDMSGNTGSLYSIMNDREVTKTVSRDVNGFETVVFTDTDGNLLGASRSGNEENASLLSRDVYSLITDKGYVDIHIPKGCEGTPVTFQNYNTTNSVIKIFNLITEAVVTASAGASVQLPAGFYRFEDVNNYYGKNNSPSNVVVPIRVKYKTNYYDTTLNRYDIAGRLTQSQTPLESGSSVVGTDFTYNSLGQVLQAKSSDEGTSKFAYRKDGQVRFSQNSEQVYTNTFSYSNYDNLGRPVESGIFVLPNTAFESLDPDTYTVPESAKKEVLLTYYDTPDPALPPILPYCKVPATYKQTFLAGNVSYTENKAPFTEKTWYSYDAYGRVKWMMQQVDGLGTCPKLIEYQYIPQTGQVGKVFYDRYSGGAFTHKYEYNTAGQLTAVYTSTDIYDVPENQMVYVKQAVYKYNESGALIRTELATNLQGIDYVYNLAGQLKAINNTALSNTTDPGNDGLSSNGFAADAFGLILDYNTDDYTRTGTPTPVTKTPQSTNLNKYDGNIKALRWRIGGTSGIGAYMHQYNKNGWLKAANFGSSSSAGNITLNASQDYTEALTYDANGNILTLNRNGYTDAAGTNAMDNFSYLYKTGTNRLERIQDSNDNPNTNRYGDIKNQELDIPPGVEGVITDNYMYNAIGQLNINVQEKVTYDYNSWGLVTRINELLSASSGEFTTMYRENYDGMRIIPTIWRSSSNIAGELVNIAYGGAGCAGLAAIYAELLQFTECQVATRNLRVIPNAYTKIELDMVLDNTLLPRYVAQGQYGADPGGEVVTPQVVIKVIRPNGYVLASTTVSNQPAEYCSRFADTHVSLEFLPGDDDFVILSLEITNNQTSGGRQRTMLDNLHVQVAKKMRAEFFYNERGHRVRKETYVSQQSKKVTYYVRDAGGNVMGVYTQDVQQSGSTTPTIAEHTVFGAGRIGMHKRSANPAGNFTLYELTDHLGNVRAVVKKVTSSGGAVSAQVINRSDYYPFGMPLPNREITDASYRYKFQGQEKDTETGMEAFELRLWDGRLGRWQSPDPYAEFHSPYLGMGNNPVSIIDPNGGCTKCPDKAAKGDTFNHPEYGEVTYDGKSWSSVENGSMIMDDLVINKTNTQISFNDVARTGADFIPVVGSGLDIYEGFRDGDGLQAAMGIGFLIVDIATLGTGSVIKGSVKTALKTVSKEVAEEAVEQSAKKLWKQSVYKNTKVFQRDDLIDLAMKDARGRTNLDRMSKGLAPLGPDGKSLNLHHMIQSEAGSIAEVTETFHKTNHKIIHINPSSIPSGINRVEFNKFRVGYWKNRAKNF